MKKIFSAVLTLSFLAFSQFAYAEPAHFIAWGDEEGTIKRKGDDLNDKNEALPLLMKKLVEIDKKDKIDGLLQLGDFVRFDPDESYYKKFLGSFINRFYPTSGGDQEFYLGRYGRFINSVPHLRFLYLDRVNQDGNGLEYYYHAIIHDTHIISLYSPDEYRENDENPEYKMQNFYINKNNPQYRWLESLLTTIRVDSKDERPIIIISHGPVFNGSKILTELFEKYKVNLVLNGDSHVLAHKSYKGTEYFIAGMMGDRALGSCEWVNSDKNTEYIDRYSYCIPEKSIFREKGKPFKFYNDNYLDIMIDKNYLKVTAINVETGKEIDYLKKN